MVASRDAADAASNWVKCACMQQVAAGEFLASAMMALLPGIDANDEHKALAVFRFYTVLLSSLPTIEVPFFAVNLKCNQ